MHPDGEAGGARAAGTAYILSTISGHRVEDVKAASAGPVCFQLYLMGGRAASEAVIERARVAGCAALVVTIDTPVAGLRERDYRNGMKELLSGSLWEKIPFLPHVLARPAWVARFLRDGGLSKLPNVIIPGQGPMDLVDVSAALARAAGEAGVARALEILRADVERTLKLLGCPSVAALDRSYVEVSAHWR